jgi:chorismate dehydratase
MSGLRLGGVSYLNARPLTWALARRAPRWALRYDVPSVCAGLLERGEIDLGLVSSIEYLRSTTYRIVPGVGIGSRGPVASVALYVKGPLDAVRTVAIDTASRTSVALLRVLCARDFGIAPAFVPHRPDLVGMTRTCDAALLIGDPAFEADHAELGLTKLDLGDAWTRLTGLPFIYAAWTGPAGPVTAADVEALQEAQAVGTRSFAAIAREYGGADERVVARAEAYLTDNIRYGLGAEEIEGLQRFLDYAVEVGAAPARRVLEFF